ncbi:competence damage inducible protein CinA [Legionella nautarum]|uniref:Competence damage inducible protein CinA n=1 Tax=Legionella nautarum TaxID=45070 RepID=A0A0W0X2Y9_9GAMM|nr:competence/damage-inducible protein A [Legionella nautarum]KTD38856.1 competence damage inducible protein CinA [Legionella nautarum]
MTVALLATGDEIIHGDILNTNSHNLAHALSSEGLPLGLQLVCSDKEQELYDCLSFLAKHHNIIIITGGLGPTSDDRTRFALGRFLKTDLVEFPAAIQHIQNRLGLSEQELNPGNRQQALFPAQATILPNPNGTAVGCYCVYEDKVFILLPGPPRECLPMFNDYVLPLLQQMTHSEKQIHKWRLFGVAESQIAQEIDEALVKIDCKTGYRLETPYVECKVRCKSQLMVEVIQIVESIAAPYIIATPEQKASELLYEKIVKSQIPISIIDEATGGILQTLIQQPDSYPWLKFYHDKDAALHFHLRGLQEYWSGQGKKGKTQVSIQYRNAKINGKETHETHELPYRSPLVIHYAAEWLSFRLFHLIDQLH